MDNRTPNRRGLVVVHSDSARVSADATVVTTILEHSSLIADEVLATGFDQSADQHTPGLIAVTVPEVEIQMGIARI